MADEVEDQDGYDVIGDIHGHGDLLERLLAAMGYVNTSGFWSHPNRRVIFVGDLIDRGAQQLKTLNIAKGMVDTGSALIVSGNHEFNAVAYATLKDDSVPEAGYCREHSEKNYDQHEAFLAEVEFGSDDHMAWIEWFKSLPLWLELDDIRIVHACWDSKAMDSISGLVAEANTLTSELVRRATQKGTAEWSAIEHLLKGPEIELDIPYLDKGNHLRRSARMNWWDNAATTLRDLAYIPNGTTTETGEPYPELSGRVLVDRPVAPYVAEVPLFFGHYWFPKDDAPAKASEWAACLDYSAGKGGPLVAYRWSVGEAFSNDRFVSVSPLAS